MNQKACVWASKANITKENKQFHRIVNMYVYICVVVWNAKCFQKMKDMKLMRHSDSTHIRLCSTIFHCTVKQKLFPEAVILSGKKAIIVMIKRHCPLLSEEDAMEKSTTCQDDLMLKASFQKWKLCDLRDYKPVTFFCGT